MKLSWKGNAVGILLSCGMLAACSAEPTSETADTSEPEIAPIEQADAIVEGTDYHATAPIQCGVEGKPADMTCQAGVKRNWGDEPGENLVEVTKPDGTVRAIFFKGTEPYGADSAQADGSAGWDFSSTRNGDMVTITFGPETYVVVDALVEGG